MAKKWYVIHTYSGYENKVKTNLLHRIQSMGMDEKIFKVEIPTETVTELKEGGRRVTSDKKVFPGYILVQMELDDESWYVVRNTPGRDRFRRLAGQAGPALARRVRPHHEAHRGGREAAHVDRSDGGHERQGDRPDRSPSSTAPSPKSTPMPARSRSWSPSSAARLRSSSASIRWHDSRFGSIRRVSRLRE